jgi:hypothetical protein
MDGSSDWTAISRLGKQILQEIAGPDTTDTLARWMSHRLAELLTAAECAGDANARQSACEAATALILRVWDRRLQWPRGWPPPGAVDVLSDVESELPRSPWGVPRSPRADLGALLGRLREFHDDEYGLMLERVLATADIDPTQRWLNAAADRMTDEEGDALIRFVARASAARRGDSVRARLRAATGEQEEAEPSPVEEIDAALEAVDKRRRQVLALLRRPGTSEDGTEPRDETRS